MSEKWDGKVVMSTPGGPIVTMSLGDLLARKDAEIEQQARHIEELREKIDAERSCACSFDAPGDVCAAHSPSLTRARADNERLTRERDEARYFLKIFLHAHASNNAVPPHLEEQARKALEDKQ